MQRTIKIIVVSTAGLLSANFLHAQTVDLKQPPAIRSALYSRLMLVPADSATASAPASVPQLLPSDYYTRHFGFFCDKELKLEKSTGIPLKLRMGSLESCNKLEGKN